MNTSVQIVTLLVFASKAEIYTFTQTYKLFQKILFKKKKKKKVQNFQTLAEEERVKIRNLFDLAMEKKRDK